MSRSGQEILSVAKDNGDGTFGSRTTWLIASNSYYNNLQVADINGDGIPDLLITDDVFESTGIVTLLGYGDGTFQQPQGVFGMYPPISYPLAFGDFNNDGFPDLALPMLGGEHVAINRGDGTFYPRHSFASPVVPTIAADINGDGHVDLVQPGAVLLGNGDGTFKARLTSVGGSAYSFTLADVNADGRLDEILIGSSRITILLGNGDGTFQSAGTFADTAAATSLMVADLNGDGTPDIVTANPSAKTLSVFLGNGNGTFTPALNYLTASGQTVLTLADVNGDGIPDIIAGSNSQGSVSAFLGDSTRFTGQTLNVLPYFTTIQGSPAADSVSLVQDPDHVHIDWTLGTAAGQLSINDPAGLTINGNGGNDTITFNYANGNPLPNRLNLNGTFTLGTMTGTNPLAGVTLDLKQSTVYVPAFLANAFLGYLKNGYDGGKWDGIPTATTGVVLSSIAATDPAHLTGIGWANAADAYVQSQPPSTFEMAFAKYGDTDLNGTVDHQDLNRFNQYLGQSTGPTWDEGDFNYDGAVNSTDAALLAANYFQKLAVLSIGLNSPTVTIAGSLSYTVTFSNNVSGVDPSDFRVVTSGAVGGSAQITVTPVSGSVYTVTVSGLHGSGGVELNLVDDDSIRNFRGFPLGGPGIGNGSFNGPVYTLQQVFPTVLSIQAATSFTSSSATYTVTFSKNVTGVDASDFHVVTTGSVTPGTISVAPVSGSVYTVTISGLIGSGTARLDLVDDGSIRDSLGNPLVGGVAFQSQTVVATIPHVGAMALADLNADGAIDLVAVSAPGIQGPDVLSIARGNGNGTFQAPLTYLINGSFYDNNIQVADLNGDGRPDLVLSYPLSYSTVVAVMLGNGDATFQPAQRVLSGNSIGNNNIQRLAVGDFNGDGFPDVALSSPSAEYISINRGDGTFYPAHPFASSPSSYYGMLAATTAADINGDGRIDLVQPSAFLLGNGDGTFKPRQTFSAVGAIRLALADVNGDGKVDALVAGANVSLLLGNGDGTFQAPHTLLTGSALLVAADVNGDGITDIVADGRVGSILLGNGDGTFKQSLTFQPQSLLAIADVNGDGRPDMVLGSYSGGNVSVLEGAATTFTGQTVVVPPVVSSINPSTTAPNVASISYTIAFSDNVTGVDPADFRVVTTGAAAASSNVTVTPVSGSVYTVTINNIHGSGAVELDLIDDDSIHGSSNFPLGGPGLYNGSFASAPYTVQPVLPPPRVLSITRLGGATASGSAPYQVTFSEPVTGVDATDFHVTTSGGATWSGVSVTPVSPTQFNLSVNNLSASGNVRLDLVDNGSIRDPAGDPLAGGPLFGTATTIAFSAAFPGVIAADLNSDGNTDFVSSSNYLQAFMGNGDGSFRATATFAPLQAPNLELFASQTADFNGDGYPDLLVADRYFQIDALNVMLGNGNGTFAAAQYVFSEFNGTAGPSAVADLNHDGRPDVVGFFHDFYQNPLIFVAINTGGGHFQTSIIPTTAQSMAATDVNSDGNVDLVCDNGVLLGNGDGTFKAVTTNATYQYPKAVTDLNGDGKPDLLLYQYSTNNTSLLLGNGNGTFQPPQFLTSGTERLVADVNGDGKPDIILTGSYGIGVLFGNGDGTFQARVTFAVPTSPASLVWADVDNDGRPDLISTSSSYPNYYISKWSTGPLVVTGPTIKVIAYLNTINGTAGNDGVTLTQDPDHQHIDWVLGTRTGQVSLNDPAGLTINGNGGSDFVSYNNANGNPLPQRLKLNGNFYLSFLSGANPLAGTTLDISTSTVTTFISSSILLGYIRNGYDAGKWDGVATPTAGVIISSAAAADLTHSTGIGWSTGAGGYVQLSSGTTELTFTTYGDTNLNHATNYQDLRRFSLYNPTATGATWDQGDFNYDGAVGPDDLTLLQSAYNQPLIVQSINRQNPTTSITTALSVAYTVTFSDNVTGVDPSDFRIVTTGDVYTSSQVTVTPQSASVYTVTVSGVHGTGTVQLNLADDDSIQDSTAYPLGGPGAGNGSFVGPTYTVQQVFPTVISITSASSPPDPNTVSYTVTFNEPVTGVDPTDFVVQPGGNVAYTGVTVTPVSDSVYSVNITGVSGVGTVGMILSDDETIRDLAGNTLVGQSVFVGLTTAAVITKPVSSVAADLNGDGNVDLVVATQNGFQTFLGHGDGLFTAAFSAAVYHAADINVVDVNGDGTPDLLVSYILANSLAVLEFDGKGDGTFRPPSHAFFGFAEFSVSEQPVAFGDLNGDGLPDAVGVDDAHIYIELNAGGGIFYPSKTYVFSNGLQPVAIADVNGDRNADIVLDNAVMLGNGDGTFKQPLTFAPFAYYLFLTSFTVLDINGDSKPDIALTDQYTGELYISFGNGDGTFKPAQTFATGPWSAIADMTGDGKLDIVGGNSATHTLAIYPGNGDGTFAPALTWDVLTPFQGFAVADVNGDGRPDLLYADNSGGTVNVLQSSGQVFTAPTSVVGNLPVVDSVTVPAGASQITLNRDPDGTEIDWTTGSLAGKLAISDPNGLTISADSAATIALNLDYSDGNPLPDTLHLSGTFLINNLTGEDPLVGKTLEIGRSTVLFNYIGPPSPTAKILQYLKAGYANGTWAGVATPASGVITSTAAANSNGQYTLGWADSADGVVAGQRPQTVEVRFTLPGDANLDEAVNSADGVILARNYLVAGKTAWDQGNFNYDSVIDAKDAAMLQKNYNAVVISPTSAVVATTSSSSKSAPAAVLAAATVQPFCHQPRRQQHERRLEAGHRPHRPVYHQ